MKILGVSFDYHDSAAALICDGEIVAASEEERFSRIKHDFSLPSLAIKYCLEEGGVNPYELDAVVFYENPLIKFDRILRSKFPFSKKNSIELRGILNYWVEHEKFTPLSRLSRLLNISEDKIFHCTHHESHAASAYYCSPYTDAAIVTMDGVGEYECASISVGKNRSISKIESEAFPNSIGLFYSAITSFLGFEVNEGEYKVMGMAAFGKNRYRDKFKQLIKLKSDGKYKIEQSYFNFTKYEKGNFLTDKFYDLLGSGLSSDDSKLLNFDNEELDNELKTATNPKFLYYADIAASLQAITEEAIVGYVRRAVNITGSRNVVLAGGVALNSLANARITRELGVSLYVQPAAGDAGSALGAALYYSISKMGGKRPPPLSNPYLGKGWTNDEVLDAINNIDGLEVNKYPSDSDLFKSVAKSLKDGMVIGWFSGRAEWGPRSLGGRSILANPAFPSMKSIINSKIKFREPFRPFAPSILSEHFEEYFLTKNKINPLSPEAFMLAVHPIVESKRKYIPAVTHNDGTGRVQAVFPSDSRFRQLLEAFFELTGIPILLNTSFNMKGEPIVNSPRDALNTFLWSGLDLLILEGYEIRKKFNKL